MAQHPTSAEGGGPSREALAALAGKYRTLATLRRAYARGEGVASREVLRALAAEFPGVLWEADVLALEEIDGRAERLERAAEGTGPLDAWMGWMVAWHAGMRAALAAKRSLRGERAPEAARAEAIAREVSSRAGVTVGADFVRAVARPPGGRLAAVVSAWIDARFGTGAGAIRGVLFPSRRGGR